MTIPMPELTREHTLWTLVATGSLVLTSLIAGSLLKYRQPLREALRRPAAPAVPYEEWTKAELYEHARRQDLAGRSTMSKAELVEALRDA